MRIEVSEFIEADDGVVVTRQKARFMDATASSCPGRPARAGCGRSVTASSRTSPSTWTSTTPSKPPGCRSRRCRRRTWTSCVAGYEALQPRRRMTRRWRCCDPDIEFWSARGLARPASIEAPRGFALLSMEPDAFETQESSLGSASSTGTRSSWCTDIEVHGAGQRDRVGDPLVELSGHFDEAGLAARVQTYLEHEDRGARSRRAVGVGDVAGERRDRAEELCRDQRGATWRGCSSSMTPMSDSVRPDRDPRGERRLRRPRRSTCLLR